MCKTQGSYGWDRQAWDRHNECVAAQSQVGVTRNTWENRTGCFPHKLGRRCAPRTDENRLRVFLNIKLEFTCSHRLGSLFNFGILVRHPKGLDKETEAACSDIEWFNATSPGYCGCEWVSFSAAPIKFYPVLDNIER